MCDSDLARAIALRFPTDLTDPSRVVSGSRMLGMGPERPGESGSARNAPRSVDVDPEARAARWLVLEVGAANGNADVGLGGEGDVQRDAPTSRTSSRKIDRSGMPQVRTRSSQEGGHPG